MENKETLKEVAEKKYGASIYDFDQVDAFIEGAKWQQERSYSKEDLKEAFSMGRLNKTIKDFNNKFKNK